MSLHQTVSTEVTLLLRNSAEIDGKVIHKHRKYETKW